MKICFEVLIRSILISMLIVAVTLIIFCDNLDELDAEKRLIEKINNNIDNYESYILLANKIEKKNKFKNKSFKLNIPKIDDILFKESIVLSKIKDININKTRSYDVEPIKIIEDNQNELVESDEIIYNNK